MSRESYLARERKRFAYDKAYALGLVVGGEGNWLNVPWWHLFVIAAVVTLWGWLRLPKEAR